MRAVFAAALSVLSAAGLVAARAGPDVHIARSVHALSRRATATSPGSSQYLTSVFQMQTAQCNSTCAVSLGDFDRCSQLSNQADIAACACSAQTLGDLRTCSSCISATSNSKTNQTGVVSAYNSFVELCSEEGLATVTGTIEVGASTKALPRSSSTTVVEASSTASTSLPASVTATASLATYNPNSAPASTATVPSLVASGSIASSARAAAASETPVNNKTSGAVGAVSVRSALAGVVALAAGLSLLA